MYAAFDETDINVLEGHYSSDLIDQWNNYGFDLAVVDSPLAEKFGLPRYQLAFKRDNKNIFDMMSQQNHKLTFPKEQNWKKIWEDVILKIKEFREKYGPLLVSSMNKNRTVKYYNKLKSLGFNVELKRKDQWVFCVLK